MGWSWGCSLACAHFVYLVGGWCLTLCNTNVSHFLSYTLISVWSRRDWAKDMLKGFYLHIFLSVSTTGLFSSLHVKLKRIFVEGCCSSVDNRFGIITFITFYRAESKLMCRTVCLFHLKKAKQGGVGAHGLGATSCPASREHRVQPSVDATSLPVLCLLSSVLPPLQWINGTPVPPASRSHWFLPRGYKIMNRSVLLFFILVGGGYNKGFRLCFKGLFLFLFVSLLKCFYW